MFDTQKIEEFNNYYYKNKKENDNLDSFLSNDNHYRKLDSIAINMYKVVNLKDSPLNKVINFDNSNNISFDTDLFNKYHKSDNVLLISSKENKNYSLERLETLVNQLKKSFNKDYGVKVMFQNDKPLIYDGHHRCSILNKIYDENYKIYPKIYLIYLNCQYNNSYFNENFIKKMKDLNLVNQQNLFCHFYLLRIKLNILLIIKLNILLIIKLNILRMTINYH